MLNDVATDVVLRDGSIVCIRQVAVEDVDTPRAFLISLSSESLYFRFLGICALTHEPVRALVDDPRGTAIAGETGGPPRRRPWRGFSTFRSRAATVSRSISHAWEAIPLRAIDSTTSRHRMLLDVNP